MIPLKESSGESNPLRDHPAKKTDPVSGDQLVLHTVKRSAQGSEL
jgi:hypothetical protein